MRKIVVLTFISLDGVMQAPGGKEEDVSDGFKYGGWTVPYASASDNTMNEQMSMPYDLLLGRKTYNIFASYWPKNNEGVIGTSLNKAKKYVVSNNNIELPWKGSTLISGDVVSKIKQLKKESGPIIQVHGSSVLNQTLLKNDLVDELWLKIFPVTLGMGKRLFGEGTIPAAFDLINSKVLPSGVIVASYKRSGDVKTGSFT